MYGGRGRGGRGAGRAGRGRGQGRGLGSGRGPTLPFSLMRELGGEGAGPGSYGGYGKAGDGRGKGRGRHSFGSRGRGSGRGRGAFGDGGRDGDGGRKRPAVSPAAPLKDGGGGEKRGRAHQNTDGLPPAKRQATRPDGSRGGGDGGSWDGGGACGGGLTRTLAAMRKRQAEDAGRAGPGSGSGSGSGSRSAPGTSSKTKFHELLVDGWESRNGREAFLEELRLQARLAKRLGKSKKDALDGMDKLMGFLSAGSGSLLPKFLDPSDRREAAELLTKASGAAADPKGTGSKSGSNLKDQVGAAAAARKAAELLERESDEELEFFGIDPGNRDREIQEDDEYGFGSDLGSGSELEEDEEPGEDTDVDEDMYGGLSSRSDDDNDDDGEDDEGDEDEDEGEDEEDGYDMYGQLMGEDSDEEDELPGALGREGKGQEGSGDEDEEEGEEGEDLIGGLSDSESGPEDSESSDSSDREAADDGNGGGEEADEDGGGRRCGVRQSTAAGVNGASASPSVAGPKYVPPALRARLAAAAGVPTGRSVDQASVQVERRVTGLVNRLAQANLQPISRDVAELYRTQGRRLVSEAVAAQILGAAESGPRASEQFAAVAAAFVSAVAAQAEAQDLAAGFLAALAERLEASRHSGDSLAQANLVTLLSYCYSAGLVGSGLCYSLLAALKERFQEADVSAMVTLLNAVGLQLRNADPGLMKEFVLGVHEKAAQLGKDGQLSRRAQLMLDLIIDIKNNKASAAGGAAAAVSVSLGGTAVGKKGKAAAAARAATVAAGGRRGGALAVLQPSIAKWLQQIGVDDICLRGLTWQKLLAPKKKGMWWVPAPGEALDDPLMLAAGSADGGGAAGTAAAAMAAAAATAGSSAASTAKLMQLAATQRMSTDARRAVFVAIMGSEDCAEAHEKLLRLPLKGDQRREIMRVLVDCCLGEEAWNPYYAFLALRLCGGGSEGGGGSVGRANRVTLQYCLWDKVKELEDMDVRQLTHLSKLAAVLVGRFAMSLSLLKVVDWSDLSAKQVFAWRVFLQHLLGSCKTAGDVKEIFHRVASQPKTLSPLISGLLLFLRSSFGPWVATRLDPGPKSDELLRRVRTAEKELLAGASTAAAVNL